jgi:hypothetical protein
MPVNAANVLVGAPDQLVTGAITSAALGTATPTSALWTPTADDKDSGYISQDGVTLAAERSTTSIIDWSGATIRTLLESFDNTLAWSMIEVNENSFKTAFGDDHVTATAANSEHGNQLTAEIGAFELPRKQWCIRMKDGLKRMLLFAPDAQISALAEVTFVKSAAIAFPVTLTTYPDAQGVSLYVFTDDGQVVTA